MDLSSKPYKVLIVDDDTNISMALSLVIKSRHPNFIIDTAVDGMEAWEMIKAENFAYDIIISDWNMPRMSGEKLLNRVRSEEKSKHLPFLMMTVRKDSESVVYAVKTGVTDYAVKPFDKDVLMQKIEKLMSAQTSSAVKKPDQDTKPGPIGIETLSSRIVNLIKTGDISLPVMPQIIFKVEEMLQREDASIPEMATLIEMDAGISSKLIGVANSIYYGGVTKCDIVEDAIARLGMQETRALIHVISNRSLFAMKDGRFEGVINDLFMHSLACGAAAKSLAKHLKLSDPDSYFALGLLHDIGKLLVLQAVSALTKDKKDLDMAAILKIADSLHTSIGEMLLTKWGFPPIYPSMALNHEDISGISEPGNELSVVHFSNLLVRKLGFSLTKDDGSDIAGLAGKALRALNNEMIKAVSTEVNDYIDKTKNMI